MKINPALELKISILVALMMVALGVYFVTLQFSTPPEHDLMRDFKTSQIVTSPVNQDANSRLESVDVLLVGLKQRLETQPNDVDGWVLLSKSYYHLDRREEAEATFAKAKALGYAGRWQPLPSIDSFSQDAFSATTQADINVKPYIKSIEARAQTNLSGNATESRIETPTQGIKLKISMASKLANVVPAEAAVFVFARDMAAPGPPLAVLRKEVHELPLELTLDDHDAMIPGRNISSVARVVVGARISITGDAVAQPGDFERLSNPIPSGYDKPVELVIESKIGS